SGIDVMFLHNGDTISAARGKPHPHLSALTDGLLYTLWDIGLKVGHSVRTVDDCVKVANSDMQSKTSLIEARFITGDERMFKYMETVVLARCVRGFEDEYIAARLGDQEARRAKFGNSATMQEPNIKNGCGGLRDFQSLIWMAFFKYRTRSRRIPSGGCRRSVNCSARVGTVFSSNSWMGSSASTERFVLSPVASFATSRAA